MKFIRALIGWYRGIMFDEECRSIGKQAIEEAMQEGYASFALVGFRFINGHMVPTVHALTAEQKYQLKRYLFL